MPSFGGLMQLVAYGACEMLIDEYNKEKKIICNNFDESIQYYFIENEDGIYKNEVEYIYESPLILDHVDVSQKPESILSFSIQSDKKKEIPDVKYEYIRDELYKEIQYPDNNIPIFSLSS